MKLARIILFTDQMNKMTAFYRDVMGLKLVTDDTTWKEFAAGGAQVALHSGPPSPGRKGPKIAFHAKDVAAARAKLNARGARFAQVREFGNLVMCDGEDPDGNPIQLSNR